MSGLKKLRSLIGVSALMIALQESTMAQQPAAAPRPAVRAQQVQPIQPQAAPSAQPSVSQSQDASPQRTTATYDDWVVQCETQSGTSPRKICEMVQVSQVTVQGNSQPFSRVAIPQPAKDHVNTLVVQVPVNVAFKTNVLIQSTDGDSGIAAPFARCVPTGCFAEIEIKDDTMRKFRSATAAGKISFADANGRNIQIPVSFNGFGKAYDALSKE